MSKATSTYYERNGQLKWLEQRGDEWMLEIKIASGNGRWSIPAAFKKDGVRSVRLGHNITQLLSIVDKEGVIWTPKQTRHGVEWNPL
jgi:hypothetical protein